MHRSRRRTTALALVGVIGLAPMRGSFRVAEPVPDTSSPDTDVTETTTPTDGSTVPAGAGAGEPSATEAGAGAPGAPDGGAEPDAPPTGTLPDGTGEGESGADGAAAAATEATEAESPAGDVTGTTSAPPDEPTSSTIAPVPETTAAVATADDPYDLDDDESELVRTDVLRAMHFPAVGPVTYAPDFGACRDACGRRHAGVDIIGPRLLPLVAAADGFVDHLVLDHPTAGWGVVIVDAEGWTYRYFHVNNDGPGTDDGADAGRWRFAPGIAPGAVVQAGQLLGWMGDSGNSEHSVPHLHFEIRQPDGVAVDPYPSLRWAQRVGRCESAAGPFSSLLVDAPEPAHEIALDVPGGVLLLGSDGTVFPIGDAWRPGDDGHARSDGPCPAPGMPIDPPIVPEPEVESPVSVEPVGS